MIVISRVNYEPLLATNARLAQAIQNPENELQVERLLSELALVVCKTVNR